MPPPWLVDTSAWIFALRRSSSPAISRRIADLLNLDACATRGVVQLELLGGTRDEPEYARLERRLPRPRLLATDE